VKSLGGILDGGVKCCEGRFPIYWGGAGMFITMSLFQFRHKSPQRLTNTITNMDGALKYKAVYGQCDNNS